MQAPLLLASVIFAVTWPISTQHPDPQNAIYATQFTFDSQSPIIYATDGICIGAFRPLGLHSKTNNEIMYVFGCLPYSHD